MPTSTEAGTVELLGATMTMGKLFVGVFSLIREQALLVSGA